MLFKVVANLSGAPGLTSITEGRVFNFIYKFLLALFEWGTVMFVLIDFKWRNNPKVRRTN